jgi:hypothetical protein
MSLGFSFVNQSLATISAFISIGLFLRNAATYALVGLIVETLRQRLNQVR